MPRLESHPLLGNGSCPGGGLQSPGETQPSSSSSSSHRPSNSFKSINKIKQCLQACPWQPQGRKILLCKIPTSSRGREQGSEPLSFLPPASPLICTRGFLQRVQHSPDLPKDAVPAAQWPLLDQQSATTVTPGGQRAIWHCSPCRAPREEGEEDSQNNSTLRRSLSSTAEGGHEREGTDGRGVATQLLPRPHLRQGQPGASPAISPAQACAVPGSHGNWTFSTPNSSPFGKEFTNKRRLMPKHRPDSGCLKKSQFPSYFSKKLRTRSPQMFPPSCKEWRERRSFVSSSLATALCWAG